MDDNIFSQKKERELQILRQRSASNVVKVDPNLKGFLDRFNPDVSRATLLRAQRARAPTKEELEKSVGVKTAKKLKKRRGKNLRGEVARNLREQRRFERGERRERPEDEPRIVGDPVPQAAGAPAQPQADPNAQLRLAIEGRRIAAQDAQQRRLVELLAERDDREREERQAILDRGAAERAEILDIGLRDRDASRAERAQILDRGEAERLQLRGAFREILEGEAAFQRQERRDILDQAEAERERLGIAGREERTALDRQARIERERILTERGAEVQELAQIRERVAEQAAAERAQDRKEREELLGQLVNLTTEERREREAREERQAQQQVDERLRQQQERERIDTQAAEEREGILRLTLDQDINPREGGGQAQADRDFLQRQFQQGLETIERRIGESEARTQEQIRQHADRVAAIERQPPIVVQQPAQQPAPTGPTAEEIAASVRQQLESPRTRERRTTKRRVEIEEQTTDTEEEDFSPTRSERRRRRQGRGAESPQPEITFEAGGEEGGFSPVQSPRPTRTPQSTGRDPPVFVSEAEERGAPEPEVAPVSPRVGPPPKPPSGPPKKQEEGVVAEPAQRPSERIPELEGSGVLVDPANLPQEGGQELFQSGQFAGDIMAAGQNAIGYVGGIASDANQRLGELFAGGGVEAVVPGEQQGGGLRDPEGNPIFGLGQEIEEPPPPTIQPLQSQEPARRVAPPAGPPKPKKTIDQEIKELTRLIDDKERLRKRLRAKNTPESRDQLEVLVQDQRERRQELNELKELQKQEQQEQQGAGLVETEEEALALGLGRRSDREDNFRLYDSLRDEIDAYYTRGRATGGARGSLPFQIVNTTDRRFKKLAPGQAVSIAQVERNGTLGYYPIGQVPGTKVGITRIGRGELEKQIKAGKLKIDRNR